MQNGAVNKILATDMCENVGADADFSQSSHGASRETSCRCGNPARPDHWDCDACHATESRIYRARQIYRRKQAMSAALKSIAIQAKACGHE